jgi:MFS family permease
VAGLFVTAQHFRPWNHGLLEEWEFSAVWIRGGWSLFDDSFLPTVGRPLAIPILYLGTALGRGDFWVLYAFLAFAALVQLAVGYRIGRRLGASSGWSAAFAFIIATHPFWPAGDILRFLPAQCSAAAFVVALHSAVMYLQGGRIRHLGLLAVSAIVGLAFYQALAVAIVSSTLALCFVCRAPWRRSAVAVATSSAAVTLVAIYVILIAPRLGPPTYEGQLLEGAPIRPLAVLEAIAKTLLHHSPMMAAIAVAIAVAALVGAARGTFPTQPAAGVVLLIVLSPLAALPYAATLAHLNDPERVAFPVSMIVALAGGSLVAVWRPERRLPHIVGAVVVSAAACAAVYGVSQWADYGRIQREVLDVIEPAVASAGRGSQVVIEDRSGALGDVYTMLPPTLPRYASFVTYRDGSPVHLCTADDVERRHPVAARFPIVTTARCSTLLTPEERKHAFTSARISTGDIAIYVVPMPRS